MSEENPWLDPVFARQYATDADDARRGWYEHAVNFPAITDLIPKGASKILDFGCGSGAFTAKLGNTYQAEGCDNAQAMVDIARQSHPDQTFFTWNFTQAPPSDHTDYDVVIAKLVVQFIPDLPSFAAAMHKILQPGGMLIISVPHPVQAAKHVADYWAEATYRQQIGTYGIYDTMVHRSLERYSSIFTEAGFGLSALSEPQVSADLLQQYAADKDAFILPKRLNMRLEKPHEQ